MRETQQTPDRHSRHIKTTQPPEGAALPDHSPPDPMPLSGGPLLQAGPASGFIWIVPLGVFLALVLLLWSGLGGNPQDVPSALVGRPVPDFALPNLHDAGAQYVRTDFLGQPYLINVWGTWCPSCRIEHKSLLALSELGVPILGLNYKDDDAQARQYLATFGDPFRWSVLDEKGTLGFDLGVTGAPETFLVDGEGIIRYRHVGVLTLQSWDEVLRPLYQLLGGQSLGGVVRPGTEKLAPADDRQ